MPPGSRPGTATRLTFSPPFNIGVGAASAYVLALIVGLFAIVYVRSSTAGSPEHEAVADRRACSCISPTSG